MRALRRPRIGCGGCGEARWRSSRRTSPPLLRIMSLATHSSAKAERRAVAAAWTVGLVWWVNGDDDGVEAAAVADVGASGGVVGGEAVESPEDGDLVGGRFDAFLGARQEAADGGRRVAEHGGDGVGDVEADGLEEVGHVVLGDAEVVGREVEVPEEVVGRVGADDGAGRVEGELVGAGLVDVERDGEAVVVWRGRDAVAKEVLAVHPRRLRCLEARRREGRGVLVVEVDLDVEPPRHHADAAGAAAVLVLGRGVSAGPQLQHGRDRAQRSEAHAHAEVREVPLRSGRHLLLEASTEATAGQRRPDGPRRGPGTGARSRRRAPPSPAATPARERGRRAGVASMPGRSSPRPAARGTTSAACRGR
mmetsp:Transcript_414/g.1170  ORF Transcript_414/g.1170 Transcript_414/m.1170 type:complete len:364 (+) Transcript_414:193-1284(+)